MVHSLEHYRYEEKNNLENWKEKLKLEDWEKLRDEFMKLTVVFAEGVWDLNLEPVISYNGNLYVVSIYETGNNTPLWLLVKKAENIKDSNGAITKQKTTEFYISFESDGIILTKISGNDKKTVKITDQNRLEKIYNKLKGILEAEKEQLKSYMDEAEKDEIIDEL